MTPQPPFQSTPVERRFETGVKATETANEDEKTDCGMLIFNDSDIRAKIHEDLGHKADHVAFLSFPDLRESVLDDIKFVKESPLLMDLPVTGYIYEVETGKIVKVE